MRLVRVGWSGEPVNVPGVRFKDYESETAFQTYCADWLRKQWVLTGDDRYSFWHHSANERNGLLAGFRAKMMGQSKGYPDFVQHGLKLAVELKIRGGKVSKEQAMWLNHFSGLGYLTEVVYEFERFRDIVLNR